MTRYYALREAYDAGREAAYELDRPQPPLHPAEEAEYWRGWQDARESLHHEITRRLLAKAGLEERP